MTDREEKELAKLDTSVRISEADGSRDTEPDMNTCMIRKE